MKLLMAKPFRTRWSGAGRGTSRPSCCPGRDRMPPQGGREEAAQSVEVETINPERKDLTREIEQPAYLRPYEMTPIYTKIAGFCKKWTYDIGDGSRKTSNW